MNKIVYYFTTSNDQEHKTKVIEVIEGIELNIVLKMLNNKVIPVHNTIIGEYYLMSSHVVTFDWEVVNDES